MHTKRKMNSEELLGLINTINPKAEQNGEKVKDVLTRLVLQTQEVEKMIAEDRIELEKQKKIQNEIKGQVDINTTSVVVLENTVGGYADAYKMNRDQIQNQQKEIKDIKIKLGMRSPYDQTD
jgi:hypothetical protein